MRLPLKGVPMTRRRDPDTGKYVENYPDDKILSVLAGERLSTTEVAAELSCDRATAYQRLTSLHEEGKISRGQVGKAFVWELTEPE